MRTENKQFKKVLSVILSICMLLSIVPSMVFAEGEGTGWTQDPATDSTGCVNELVDGWVHLKSGPNNGNAATGTTPAVFVSDTMTGGKFGTVNLAIKPVSGPTETRFGVYLNYENPNNGYFIGYDAGGWFWQRYGDDGSYKPVGIDAPEAGEQVILKITWSDNTITSATVDGQSIFGGSTVDISYTTGDKIAIKCGTWNTEYTEVYVCDADNIPEETTESTEATEPPEVPVDPDRETVVLTNDAMSVTVDAKFPRVIKYDLANGNVVYGQTKTLDTIRINGVDLTVDPETVVTTEAADKVTYKFPLKSEDNTIDMEMTCELVIENNTLAFNITEIKNNLDSQVNPILKIYIPQHSLVSVNANDDASNLFGAIISSKTKVDGDEYFKLTNTSANKTTDYAYAVISDSKISASMESNSTVDGRSNGFSGAGANNTRIVSEVYDGAVPNAEGTYETVKTLGLQSNTWDYQYRVTTNVGGGSNDYATTYVYDPVDMPYVRVVITGDENGDGAINWNDGAIAFRDISHEIAGSEEVPELVGYRISMNFGGQAQNPFLTTLDNVKRVAANTDGLGQSILLKGYASEGHDSGHPDYWNIGERIGGAEDMNTLLTKGAEYGAVFGIHVNASEFYPEAEAFNENRIKWNTTGTPNYGWNWIDQGINMNGWYDMANYDPDATYDDLYRENRFQKLYELVGTNLDFVYVDVWGNGQTPSDGTWGTRVISQEITERGWRMANEWGVANDWDATFTHWSTDLTYGGADLKGVNSTLIRFIRNHQKDVWVGDYPSYGGEAQAPLLGGMNMKDFEGWQGRNDYDAWITNLYTHNLSTKFLQHFEVVSWEYANDADPTVPVDGANWTPSMKAVLRDDAGNEVVVTRKSSDPNSAEFRERVITFNGITVLDGSENRGDNDNSKGNQTYLIPWLWDSSTGEFLDSKDEKLYHWNTAGGTTTWTLPESWSDVSEVKYYKLTDLGAVEEQIIKVDENHQITIKADAETPYIVKKGDATKLEIVWSEGMHIVDAGFNSGIENILSLWTTEGTGSATVQKSQYSNPMLVLNGEISAKQELTDLTAGTQYAVYLGVDNRSDSDAYVRILDSNGNVVAENYTNRSIAKNYIKAYTHSNSSATVDGTSYFQNIYLFFTPVEGEKYYLQLEQTGEGNVYFDDIRITESEASFFEYDEEGNVTSFFNDFEDNVQGVYPFVIGGIESVEDNRTHLSELHDPYTQAGWDIKQLDDVIEGEWSVKVNGLVQRNAMVMQTIPQNFRFEPGVTYDISFDYEIGTAGTYGVVYGDGEFSTGKQYSLLPLNEQAIINANFADVDDNGEINVNDASLVQLYLNHNPGTTIDTTIADVNLDGMVTIADVSEIQLIAAGRKEAPTTGTVKHTFSFSLIGAESGQSWFGIYSTSKAPENTDSFIGYKDLVIDNVSIKVSKSDKSEMMAAYEKYSGLNEVDYAPDQWAVFAEALANVEALFQNSDAEQAEVDAATQALIDAAEALEVAYGTITVTVKDEEGNPIEGAKVALDCYNDDTIAKQTGVADENGMVTFNNLRNREYGASASADGYTTRYGVTAPITVNETTNTDVILNKVSADGLLKEYDFEDGDVSMFVSPEDNAAGAVAATAVDGKAQIKFPGGGRACVYIEDEDLDRVKNGRIEADITAMQANGIRFGVNFRGSDFNHRVWVGVGDANDKYFWEWWNGSATSYSGMYSGQEHFKSGETVHLVAEIKNNTVKLTLDGEVVLNTSISGNIPTDGGWFGFECRNGYTFQLDNVKIYTNDTDPVF